MNEGHAEDDLDFSGSLDGELLEIVNSSSGRYRQELVDGAKHELEQRGGDNVRAESNHQVMSGGVPPGLLENVSGRKVFSIGQITLASFLGAPISGCLLLAQNYRALGKGRSVWQPLVIGVAATILLMTLALVLPEKFPNMALHAASCLGMYFYAKRQLGDTIDNHLKAGGKIGSWWVMIAVSLGCTVLCLVLLVAVAITFDIPPPGGEPSRPVAKVKVSQAGQIELNGTNVTLEELRVALTSLKDENGEVWYYRERPAGPAPAVATKVISVIANAELPIRMSSKPDFSDYIDADGKSVPLP
jgi:hypothetical protein